MLWKCFQKTISFEFKYFGNMIWTVFATNRKMYFLVLPLVLSELTKYYFIDLKF